MSHVTCHMSHVTCNMSSVPYKYIAHTHPHPPHPHPHPHPMPHHLPHPKSGAHHQPNALAARAFSSDPRLPPRHHPPPKRSDATKSHTAPTSSCSCNNSFAHPIFSRSGLHLLCLLLTRTLSTTSPSTILRERMACIQTPPPSFSR